MKDKQIPKKQFENWLAQESGSTVALNYDVWPDWARKARNPKIDHILFWPFEGPQMGETYNFDTANGRLTVIRYDEKDVTKGFPYNKDVYIYVCADDNTVIQFGPFSKGEPDHWMSSLSDEYKDWPVVFSKEKDKKI